MAENPVQVLDDAVARNLGAVLSLPSAGMLRHHKSRFLDATEDGIWIESAAEDRALVEDLIARNQPAAISFKSATTKVSFAAMLLRRDPEHRINGSTCVEAVLVRRPEQVKSVQRRSDYRVRVLADSGVMVHAWRIAEQTDLRDTPPAAQELKVDLRDISLGGIGITLLRDVSAGETCAIRLLMDERIRVMLQSGDQQITLEGRVRHLPRELHEGKATGDIPLRVGVQFSKLESAIEGRQVITTMTRIVGQLQRDEVRRVRLGMVNGDGTDA